MFSLSYLRKEKVSEYCLSSPLFHGGLDLWTARFVAKSADAGTNIALFEGDGQWSNEKIGGKEENCVFLKGQKILLKHLYYHYISSTFYLSFESISLSLSLSLSVTAWYWHLNCKCAWQKSRSLHCLLACLLLHLEIRRRQFVVIVVSLLFCHIFILFLPLPPPVWSPNHTNVDSVYRNTCNLRCFSSSSSSSSDQKSKFKTGFFLWVSEFLLVNILPQQQLRFLQSPSVSFNCLIFLPMISFLFCCFFPYYPSSLWTRGDCVLVGRRRRRRLLLWLSPGQ